MEQVVSDATHVIRRLHQHREWVNSRLLGACALLSEEQLHQPFPMGQGSVWKSLLHLHAAEYVWLEALLGNQDPLLPGDRAGALPGNQLEEGGVRSFDHLAQQWAVLKERWDAYLSELSDATLNEVVLKKSTSSGGGKVHGTSRVDVLLHVCTHAQYTTAQTLNMLRRLGVESLPDVMLITMARQRQRDE